VIPILAQHTHVSEHVFPVNPCFEQYTIDRSGGGGQESILSFSAEITIIGYTPVHHLLNGRGGMYLDWLCQANILVSTLVFSNRSGASD
jgi:hypothetical protein